MTNNDQKSALEQAWENFISPHKKAWGDIRFSPRFRYVPSTQEERNQAINLLLKGSDALREQQKNSNFIQQYKNFYNESFGNSDIGYNNTDNLGKEDFSTGVFDMGKNKVPATEMGNVFVGINAQRSGIPLPILKAGAMAWTIANFGNALQGRPNTNSPIREFRDWPLYDMGYKLAQNQPNITTNDIVDAFTQSLYKEWTQYGK